MSDNDARNLIEQGMLFGMGVAVYTTEKAGQVLGTLFNSKNLNSEEGKRTVDDVIERAKSEFGRISDLAKDTASKVFNEGEVGKVKDSVFNRQNH